jgi:hypothetical protein
MSFTRIALETHITHMRTGVKFYMLAGSILHASQLRDVFMVTTVT